MIWLINAGGSSIKFRAEDVSSGFFLEIEFTRIGLKHQEITIKVENKITTIQTQISNVEEIIKVLIDKIQIETLSRDLTFPTIVGYRVKFAGDIQNVVSFDESVIQRIEDEAYLNRQHATLTLALRKYIGRLLPKSEHLAIPDSGLFKHLPIEPLPLSTALMQRYELRSCGHHGLACESILNLMSQYSNTISKIITVHMGSGVSVSAFDNEKPFFNSMLYSAYDGPIMNNRSGDLPIGSVLQLIKNGMKISEISNILGEQSGIYALNDIPHNSDFTVKDLLSEQDTYPNSTYYFYKIAELISKAISRLSSIDAIVFSGGIINSFPPLIQAILRYVPGLPLEDMQEIKNTIKFSGVHPLHLDKLAIFLAKPDEFQIMKRYLNLKSNKKKSLIARCLCPGVGKGKLIEYNGFDTPRKAIIVADRVTPELVIRSQFCSAIVVDIGDPTSHGAALAREIGVPCVAGVPNKELILFAGKNQLIVDATAGAIYCEN